MLKKFLSFWREEDGGADQLIVAASLVVVGIGIAILFGDKIKAFVESLLPEPDPNLKNRWGE
jgi:hypothetical protein